MIELDIFCLVWMLAGCVFAGMVIESFVGDREKSHEVTEAYKQGLKDAKQGKLKISTELNGIKLGETEVVLMPDEEA